MCGFRNGAIVRIWLGRKVCDLVIVILLHTNTSSHYTYCYLIVIFVFNKMQQSSESNPSCVGQTMCCDRRLWRANWQKGVAGWGMLGGGISGEWTSVVRLYCCHKWYIHRDFYLALCSNIPMSVQNVKVGEFGGMEVANSSRSVSSSTAKQGPRKQKLMKIFNHSSFVGTNVSNSPGGSIDVDQNALTTWSIDAIRVVPNNPNKSGREGIAVCRSLATRKEPFPR
jgi:hypothetical protein